MGVYSNYATDADLEKDGVKFDMGSSGIFKLARAGGSNEKYNRRLFEVLKPHRRAIDAGTFDPKLDRQIAIELFVDTVLISWEGVQDRDGNDLPFSRAAAIQLFTDLPDFFVEMRSLAGQASHYRAEIRENDAKN